MMSEAPRTARIPLQISQSCIVASVQVDLRPEVLANFQSDVLELVRDSGARALIVDLSGVDTIDPEEFDALRRTSDMVRLMGARPILSGLKAGVVSSLVDLDVNLTNIEATRSLDGAFDLVNAALDTGNQGQRQPTSTLELDNADDPDSN
jgi:rsbT antagonist protein RsbS